MLRGQLGRCVAIYAARGSEVVQNGIGRVLRKDWGGGRGEYRRGEFSMDVDRQLGCFYSICDFVLSERV